MKEIAEQASKLVGELRMIADNLEEYNPGRLCKDKIPLGVIQYDLACLGRELTWLYAEIGKKIKDETILNEDPRNGSKMRQFKYFELEDFACPCCKRNEIKIPFVEKLDRARNDAEIPFIPTSGYRCEKHNKEAGGLKTSSHLLGVAVDLKATSSQSRYKIVKSLLAQGFTRIGIGGTFIHVDDDKKKVAEVIWLY